MKCYYEKNLLFVICLLLFSCSCYASYEKKFNKNSKFFSIEDSTTFDSFEDGKPFVTSTTFIKMYDFKDKEEIRKNKNTYTLMIIAIAEKPVMVSDIYMQVAGKSSYLKFEDPIKSDYKASDKYWASYSSVIIGRGIFGKMIFHNVEILDIIKKQKPFFITFTVTVDGVEYHAYITIEGEHLNNWNDVIQYDLHQDREMMRNWYSL